MRLSSLSVILLLALTSCHSAFVDATVSNRTTSAIPLIEVDYPTASFGTQNLAPGADFHYRFKVLGTGPLKVIYTDSTRHEQQATGPELKEGAEGPLEILFTASGVQWKTRSAKH